MKLKHTIYITFVLIIGLSSTANAQYWQQKADYTIRVSLDPGKNSLSGVESIIYTNNSPDTLTKVYYHLYFNAFQPGSSMDIRSRTILDPDERVGDRIYHLKPFEMGKYSIKSIEQDTRKVKSYSVDETIMEVTLSRPIMPGGTTVLDMEFECQIPIQIRRSGRDNMEGIQYSMSQWYPKLCEYDHRGWATDPYIGREFYGVWGDFDVYITLPDSFKVAGTGVEMAQLEVPTLNKNMKVGSNSKPFNEDSKLITHYFKAEKVHDFVWAADPQYTLDIYKVNKDLSLTFAYQATDKNRENWKKLQPIMAEAIQFASEYFGKYPYSHYSFIQGGDGGMEYPMATLIVGDIPLNGLISVSVHEMMHSWFQGVLGFNESLYYWMDEGFTSYAETIVKDHLKSKGMFPGKTAADAFKADNKRLVAFYKSGHAENLASHADHFNTNAAYGVGAYVKGSVFLSQLGYIIGEQALHSSLLKLYTDWQFKHPEGEDFIRIAEKKSGLQLDWYYRYMIYSNDLPDYAIDSVSSENGKTHILLKRKGLMPMPVDIVIEMKSGKKQYYTIPLDLMLGSKKQDLPKHDFTSLNAWAWVNPNYIWSIETSLSDIKSIQIDPSGRMVDLNEADNTWTAKE